MVDRIGFAHPPTVASATAGPDTWRSIVAAVCGRRSWKTWRRPASVRTVSAACRRRTRWAISRDVAEGERVHARHGRVVEQPQQPPVGDGEDRARARPGRGRRDEPHVLALVERVEQLRAEREPQRRDQPVALARAAAGAPAAGGRGAARSCAVLRGRADQVVGGVDLRHPQLGLLPRAAIRMPALRRLAVGGGDVLLAAFRGALRARRRGPSGHSDAERWGRHCAV